MPRLQRGIEFTATDTGAKLNNEYIEVRQPISRSNMEAISNLPTNADLTTVINTVNSILNVIKS